MFCAAWTSPAPAELSARQPGAHSGTLLRPPRSLAVPGLPSPCQACAASCGPWRSCTQPFPAEFCALTDLGTFHQMPRLRAPWASPCQARYAAKVTRSPQLPSKRSTACLPAPRRHGLWPHGAPRSPASEAGLAWKVPVTDGCPAVRLPCGQAASSQPPCGVGRGDRATGQGRASTSPSPHTDPRGTPRPGPALRGAATGRPAA